MCCYLVPTVAIKSIGRDEEEILMTAPAKYSAVRVIWAVTCTAASNSITYPKRRVNLIVLLPIIIFYILMTRHTFVSLSKLLSFWYAPKFPLWWIRFFGEDDLIKASLTSPPISILCGKISRCGRRIGDETNVVIENVRSLCDTLVYKTHHVIVPTNQN